MYSISGLLLAVCFYRVKGDAVTESGTVVLNNKRASTHQIRQHNDCRLGVNEALFH